MNSKFQGILFDKTQWKWWYSQLLSLCLVILYMTHENGNRKPITHSLHLFWKKFCSCVVVRSVYFNVDKSRFMLVSHFEPKFWSIIEFKLSHSPKWETRLRKIKANWPYLIWISKSTIFLFIHLSAQKYFSAFLHIQSFQC